MATTVRSRWNGGNLEFLSAAGAIIMVIDGTNGRITLGTSAATAAQELHVFDGGADKAARLVLYDHNGTANYVWVDSSGDLRIAATTAPANDTSGTIVGTQS